MVSATFKFGVPFVFLFAVHFDSSAMASAQRDLVIALREVTPCPAKMSVGWKMSNVTLFKDATSMQTSISAIVTLVEPYLESFSIYFELFKCVSLDESSCYKFLVLEDTNMCKDLQDPDKMWQPMLKYVNFPPNVSCPLAAGMYQLTKVPITQTLMEREVYFPGIWRAQISFKDGARVLGCIHVSCEVKMRPRPRKRLP